MAILLSSGAVPLAVAKGSTPGTFTFQSAAPSFVGQATFLDGPTPVGSPTSTLTGSNNPTVQSGPELNVKPAMGSDPPPVAGIPPTVNCVNSGGQGCYPISPGSGNAASNPHGLSAVNSRPFTVEPPDQGLCAGNGYAIESANLGEIRVFDSSLAPVSGVISLDSLMGLTAKGWSSGGDVMCTYDGANGGHWFIIQIVSASTEASGGPFGGCFAGVPDTCYEGIAVSTTSDPLGSYNVYFLNANTVNNDPGSDSNPLCYSTTFCPSGILLNDYAKIATTNDALLMFYDEFPLYGGFNGAQEFAFSKNALETGSSTVNVAVENMGSAPNLYPIPANGQFQPGAYDCSFGLCWYQVIPAQTDPSQYDNSNGGTGFMVASLDFFGFGDNRVAVFDWTGLSSLNSPGCSTCSSIAFGGQLLTGLTTYQDEGGACPVTDYYSVSTFFGLSAQKAGPTPLGDNCALLGHGLTSPCSENGIATNGDGATDAFYGNGEVWTAVSTIVTQKFNHGASELHVGAAYWGVQVPDIANGGHFTIGDQGIISAAHEDIEFPSVAVGGRSVLVAFTLSGDGGPTGADGGGFYPSTAYLLLSGSDHTIHVADAGQAPQDGFTQYRPDTRPRWGDYSQAVFDSGTGRFYFSTEFIQTSCSDSTFLADHTCGGTRAPAANWGTSINYLHV